MQLDPAKQAIRDRLIWTAKVLLAAGLIVGFLLRSDAGMIFEVFRSVSPAVFLGLAVIQLISFWLNALKWSQFLPGTSLSRLFKLILIGHYYSMLIPGQIAGEAVKIYRLGDQQGGPGASVRAVVLDRITGVTSILAVAAAGASISGSDIPKPFVPWLLVALTTIAFGFWLRRIFHRGKRAERADVDARCFGNDGKALPESGGWVVQAEFFDRFARAQVIGIGLQLLCVSIVCVLGREIGIFLKFADWCWIFGLVSLAVFLPVTIAGLGLREAGFVFLTGLYQIPLESALGLSLMVLGLQLISALFGGAMEISGKPTANPANGQVAAGGLKAVWVTYLRRN